MSNTIWMSGSRGFVGQYVKQQLADAGVDFKCVSYQGGDDIVEMNFSSKESIKAAIEKHGVPETFLHIGWGNVYEPHHECHINENLQDGKNIVDVLYESGVKRIIHIGSSSEYGDRVGELKVEHIDPLGDVNNYIKGKVALAKYGLEKAKEHDKVFVHARLSYTYGAGQQHNSLINQLHKNAVAGNEMQLSPCTHFRDYIFVEDAAEGIIAMAKSEQSGLVNLGSGTVIELKEFVKIFWRELGGNEANLQFGSHDQPEKEQAQPRSFVDLTELKAFTGWAPHTSKPEGIKKAVASLHQIHGTK